MDGFLSSEFCRTVAVTVDMYGVIYVADGNAIRAIGRRFFPLVETFTDTKRGFADGELRLSQFNRIGGLASDETGNLFVSRRGKSSGQSFDRRGKNRRGNIWRIKRKNSRFTPQEFRQFAAAALDL